MPTIRKLAAEEVQTRTKRGESARAQVARTYDGYLAEFSPDDYAEVLLDEGESKLTVRNRLKAAAQRRGWSLQFLRTPGRAIRFRVAADGGEEATDEEEDEATQTSGNPEEDEQFEQLEQAEGPQPTRRRRGST